jgi:hydroxymethylbilane synthase
MKLTTQPLTIGTRGSRLALAQTELVRTALLAHYPELQVLDSVITTKGDVALNIPLAQTKDKGLFITEIEEALRSGQIDLAVHSAKDLPSQLPHDLLIAAYPARADARDALISPSGSLAALPPGARVGTGSPRRAAQLRALRPDLVILDIRGNVDTRLRKLEDGAYDALVLAAAGLHRLSLERVVSEYLDPAVMMPAVGQGALAVEIRGDDYRLAALLAPLDHLPTAQAVNAERSFLARMNAGCSAAVGAYAIVERGMLMISAIVGGADGQIIRAFRDGAVADGVRLAEELADTLLRQGAGALLTSMGGGAHDDE